VRAELFFDRSPRPAAIRDQRAAAHPVARDDDNPDPLPGMENADGYFG
jgi:hypothetical protein